MDLLKKPDVLPWLAVLVLINLKLYGKIDWSWLIVFSPVIAVYTLVAIATAVPWISRIITSRRKAHNSHGR